MVTERMSNGGRKFSAEHTARRYRPIACAGCGSEFIAYGQRKLCDACKAAKAKTPEALQKVRAQRAVVKAIRDGALVRQSCVLCTVRGIRDGKKAHGHHEDYSKPIDVIWLCSFHHIKRHEELRSRPSVLNAAELVEKEVREHREYRRRNPNAKVPPLPGDSEYPA